MPSRDAEAFDVVSLRLGPLAPVGADHPEVVIGDGTALVVTGGLAGLEGRAVVSSAAP